MPYPSFARVRQFGRRMVGLPIWVIVSGLISAAALTLLLLAVPLVAELLSTHGAITASAADSSTINALGVTPADNLGPTVHYDRCGLLPTVWRLRDTWIGGTLRGLYVSWPSMRDNQHCLASLILVILILAIVSAGTLY